MSGEYPKIQNVAIIGAGVSGVAAGVHFKRAGLTISIFERTSRAGGVWVYDDRTAKDAAYPSTVPSAGDSPEWESFRRKLQHGRDSPMEGFGEDSEPVAHNHAEQLAYFAPPGPCYASLKNNVSTIEMEMTCQTWKPGTEEFVPHHVLGDYIQDAAQGDHVLGKIQFNSRVDRVEKVDGCWELEVSKMVKSHSVGPVSTETSQFDAVVIASGHYHACNIPDIPGLSTWKQVFPNAIRHSKLYLSADHFRGKTILLVGGGVSSMDIAKVLGKVAKRVIKSTRDGPYELPAHLLPDNAVRVAPIQSFNLRKIGRQPPLCEAGSVVLADGRTICSIDQVIVCAGYHVSFPYMRQYHADDVHPANAGDSVVVTNGQQVHNLYKEIWYIPDLTLAFIGVPYHVATFSAFEFQAKALAAVFAGEVHLPDREEMRREYNERLKRKWAGRTFHSLKGDGEEIAYVAELVAMVNGFRKATFAPMLGHTKRWHKGYARRLLRRDRIFSFTANATHSKRLEEVVSIC